jgi:putative protease
MYELLAPAGNKECALAAIQSGADAVYLGYSSFSARAGADNFDLSALREIISYAHIFGVKIYVTMNTLIKEREREEFLSTLVAVHNAGADGILLQDIFLGKYIHEHYPSIVLHLSTQAGVNNVYGASLAKEYGFSRVVLARETGIEDIREISKIIETEAFVQGALCTCFSGQCYFSSFIGGNSGNRGRCKQPCRKRYTYDTGERKENYALSLSDLCVGEKVEDLLSAGVYSLKIEGRMRRPEYVAAAVRYYKKLLSGGNAEAEFSDLKRTYNRGNYTEGLAFGQDKRFLSTAVQGHIGEKVGIVKVLNGKYYVESRETFSDGCAFKILRGGEEVGGGSLVKRDGRGFYLSSRERLKNGDSVFITTDTAVTARLLCGERKQKINVTVRGEEGDFLTAESAEYGITMTSDFRLQTAKTAPMSEADVKNCFAKTDGAVESITQVSLKGNCFALKSELNAFRRAFYAAVYARLSENKNVQYEYIPAEKRPILKAKNPKKAVMGASLAGIDADIYIYKPNDYEALPSAVLPEKGEKYLYLPPFLSGEEIEKIEKDVAPFDGIYCDGTYGLVLAKKWGKKLFAGTGFNLSNTDDILPEFDNYVLSKELDLTEQQELATRNAFVLTAGSLKLMDIIYCPFGKKCAACEKRGQYALTDEGGRSFTLRRYRVGGRCRFELYNCASLLAPQDFAGVLIDLSDLPMPALKAVAEGYEKQEKIKELLGAVTAGHSKKSVL